MAFSFPARIYPIIDAEVGVRPARELAKAVLAAGAPLLQLRVKSETTLQFVETAREVHTLCRRNGAKLIINDRTDIAALIGADGVHLGQHDLPPREAREILGADKIIGFSTHNAEQLERAIADEPIDYAAFGPIFATRSKANPDPIVGIATLRGIRSRCPLPLVAIGGITVETLPAVLAAGADCGAVISAIAASEDPEAATRALLETASL